MLCDSSSDGSEEAPPALYDKLHNYTFAGNPNYGSIHPDSASFDSDSTTVGSVIYIEPDRSPCGDLYSRSEITSWKSYIFQEVSMDILLSVELLLLTFCTGILDAMTMSAYHVFCSKQTGNTILIAWMALEPLASEPNRNNAALSFAFFTCSALLFSWCGNLIGQRRRIWLLLSNSLSTALLLAAAVLEHLSGELPTKLAERGIIGCLAMACGGQLQLALSVRVPDLNTTMITTAVVNLASDPNITSISNYIRNQRILSWLSILTGAFVGASVSKFLNPMSAILIAAAVKAQIGCLFLFNRGAVG